MLKENFINVWNIYYSLVCMGGSIPAFISGAHKSEEGVGSPRTGVTDCGKLPCERREEPLSRLSSSEDSF